MAPPMRVDPRIAIAGFGLNTASFLCWTVFASWSRYEEGAPAWLLGVLPLPSGIAYVLVCLWAGRLSDRVSRVSLAKRGLLLFAAFTVLAWWSHHPLAIAALGLVNGAAMALIWPALQARIADESTAEDLEKRLGEFSLSWSAGKTAGFFAFPFLHGFALPLGEREDGPGLDPVLLCGLLALVLIPMLPRAGAPRHAASPPLVRDDVHPPTLRAAHLRVGWIANFAAYGLGSVVLYLYPDLLKSLGRPASEQGWVLGTVYGSQTLGFWLFGRFAGWRYRLAPLVGWMCAGSAALLAIGLGAPLALSLPAAAVLGLALGQAYSASVYYSVHSESDRGARAGVHEAVIGGSDVAFTLIGGGLASALGWTAAPYFAAAAISGAAMALAARVVRKAAT